MQKPLNPRAGSTIRRFIQDDNALIDLIDQIGIYTRLDSALRYALASAIPFHSCIKGLNLAIRTTITGYVER